METWKDPDRLFASCTVAVADRPGGAAAIILSHQLWQRRFGGDPAIVGTSIQLSGQSYEVVGVLPAGAADWMREAVFTMSPATIPLYQPSRPDKPASAVSSTSRPRTLR